MRRLVLAGVLALSGCSPWYAQPLPTPVSPPPVPAGTFRAGAARVDITPPPGLGLGGTGPEDRRSTGYRTRLYARALVLEDATGERIALVVLDLPHAPSNLHRLAASRLVESTGIGADRLVISATHAHSSYSHFYGERQYNQNSSRIAGYDPQVVDLIVRGIVAAVQGAVRALEPAVAATGSVPVIGATSNRSVEAFCLNPGSEVPQCASEARRDTSWLRQHAVDTTLFLLRVDARGSTPAHPRTLATYTIFAVHGTAIPSLNTLYDADVHGRVVQRLEAAVPGAVHLLANGAEGDVVPLVSRRDACPVPRLGLADPMVMPRGPDEAVDFIEPGPSVVERCLSVGLEEIQRPVRIIADSALALYRRLQGTLTDEVPIRRAFATAWLPGVEGLCREPVTGSSTAAGADGMETRIKGWDWLFWPLFRLALVEGGPAVKETPDDCQSPKRTLLGPIQSRFVVGEHGFPAQAQFTVIRVGDALLGAVPGEVTSVAGGRMKDAMREASEWHPSQVALIGLANGFLQYVTTAEEYRWQAYEGGSNLYGPATAGFFARQLGQLASGITPAPSAPAQVAPITAYPGPPSAILPNPVATGEVRVSLDLSCRGGRLVGELRDRSAAALFPREGPLVELWARRDSVPVLLGSDLSARMELRLRGDGREGSRWEVRWMDPVSPGAYQLRRPASGANGESASGWVSCGT